MKIKKLDILLIEYILIGIMAITILSIFSYLTTQYQSILSFLEGTKYLDIVITILMIIASYVIYLNALKGNNNAASKKQRIITQYIDLSNDFEKAISKKSENAQELSRMYRQKVQILNRQINNEDRRDLKIDDKFYSLNREMNNRFEEKYF